MGMWMLLGAALIGLTIVAYILSNHVSQAFLYQAPIEIGRTKIPDNILTEYKDVNVNSIDYHHIIPYINALRARVEELESRHEQ